LETLAEHYRRKEAPGEQRRILETQLKLSSDAETQRHLRYALAELLEKTGTHAEAEKYYQFILKDSPREMPAIRTLGSAYAKAKKWVELAALYENELKGTEEPSEVLGIVLRLANLYEKQLSDRAKAISYRQRACELWPQNALLVWDLQRLYEEGQDW